jgi:hypothetical protein
MNSAATLQIMSIWVKHVVLCVKIHYANELLHNSGPPSRIFPAQHRVCHPICDLTIQPSAKGLASKLGTYTITGLDNSCNVVIVVCFLFPGSLQTFHGSNLLIQLALYDGQLSSQLQRIDVQQLDFFRAFRSYWCRWRL